jgi:hypothetical protein
MNELSEFRSHIEPPDTDRTSAARAVLSTAIANETQKQRKQDHARRPAALGLATATAVAAVAAAAALIGSGGSGANVADAAIIHHAAQALSAPPNEILHALVTGDGFSAESWQLTSPPYSYLGLKGPIGHQGGSAGDATTSSYYDPATNTIDEQPGGAQKPFEDPLTAVHQQLQQGNARVVGTATTDGVPTYEIQFADNGAFGSGSLIAYVDQRTYRPLVLLDPQRTGGIVRLTVRTLEFLPATPQNLRLLSLEAKYPGATVIHQ